MPNFDGGHYFLTALVPLKTDLIELDGIRSSSVHLVREALSLLPPAMQSKAAEAIGLNSPFAGSLSTHFTRFVVIDDVSWNGRVPVDPLIVAARDLNPTVGSASDELTCPFLLWAVDFDAASGEAEELERYLLDLWNTAGPDLRRIFTHCVGFGAVKDGRSFADYIAKCQIETTMPFNDYWIDPPPFVSLSKIMLVGPVLLGAVVTLVGLSGLIGRLLLPELPWVWGILVLALLFGGAKMLYTHRSSLMRGQLPIPIWAALAVLLVALFGLLVCPRLSAAMWLTIFIFGLVALAASTLLAHRRVAKGAATPFPVAPNSDLRSILKALYLQQKFTKFVIATQGSDNASLHAAFGRFLQDHKPLDVAGPTQTAGVIRHKEQGR